MPEQESSSQTEWGRPTLLFGIPLVSDEITDDVLLNGKQIHYIGFGERTRKANGYEIPLD